MPDRLHIWLAISGSYETLSILVKSPDDDYNFWMEEEFNIDSFESELVGEAFLGINPPAKKITEQILYKNVQEKIADDLQKSSIDLRKIDSIVTLISTDRDNLSEDFKRNASSGDVTLLYLGSYDLPN